MNAGRRLRAAMLLHRRAVAGLLAGAAVLPVAVLGLWHPRAEVARADATVTVSSTAIAGPIPSGFVGLSFEYPALLAYAGQDPGAINPVLVALLRDLAPGQRPVLRIGGDSTDATWWPAPGLTRPLGVTYSLSRQWLAVIRALARALGARLILGLNLEANVPQLAAAEGRAVLRGLGPGYIEALEIGNEPSQYRLFPWYRRSDHRPVFARSRAYGYAAFSREFSAVARSLPRDVPVAGPALPGRVWMQYLPRFITAQPRLGVVTSHQYPLNRCFSKPGSAGYPTVARVLTPYASRHIDSTVARYVMIARHHGLALRIDESNSVACGGKPGVSDSFASALWAVDWLFGLARAGVAGVNFHSSPGAAYAPFGFHRVGGHWMATVHPVYYGLLMFAGAAPPGARLLRVRTTAGQSLRAWATRSPRGTVRVVLINDDRTRQHVVLVRAPRSGSATVVSLTAPSPYATAGAQYGGWSFGPARTDALARLEARPAAGVFSGGYVVTVAPASAALLTVTSAERAGSA